ncbi:MAG: rhomboid family intramembrane serine protease [Planctomycetes bacterium]|nr:rhomboid family intramembrane serine protease [Planctomycetota bacterium]
MDYEQHGFGEVVLLRASSPKKIHELALVLKATSIEHAVRQEGPSTWAIVVLESDFARALDEVQRYEQENRGWPPRETAAPAKSDWITSVGALVAVLVVFHVAAIRGAFGFDWYAAGAADGTAMRAGEWWRAITALTLHASLEHLLGNLVFGSFFAWVVTQTLGAGLGWAAIVLAGSLGFAAEALVRGDFTSIGASTGVFAALGVQVAHQWRMRRVHRMVAWKRWAPVFAGFVLLGYLGISDPKQAPEWMAHEVARIDVLGHAAGFVMGLVVGWFLGSGPRGVQASPRVQALLGGLALATIGGAWAVALLAAH